MALLLIAPLAVFVPRAGASEEHAPSAACNANPAYYKLVTNEHPEPSARKHTRTYRYVLNGSLSTTVASFYDGCSDPLQPAGDGAFEFGKNGLLIKQSLATGKGVIVAPSWGGGLSFIVGSDGDGSGIIGDTPLDCIEGPFFNGGTTLCPADPRGFIVMIPTSTSTNVGAIMAWVCGGEILLHCEFHKPKPPGVGLANPPWAKDGDGDGMGDGWEESVEKEGMRLLGRLMDQETANNAHPYGGDGLVNLQEFRWDTLPLGPLDTTVYVPGVGYQQVTIFPNAYDWDYDRWDDGPEVAYWNDPSNDPALDDPSWSRLTAAPIDPDYSNGDYDADGLSTTHDPDSDNDGTLDGTEFNDWSTYPEFADSDCPLNAATCPTPRAVGNHTVATKHASKPGTGDGINDTAERAAWDKLGLGTWQVDYDQDGVASNLLDPESDGDGLLDGAEFNCVLPPCTNPSKFDSDGDSLLDGGNLLIGSNDRRMMMFRHAGIAHEPASYGQVLFYGERDAKTNPSHWDTDGDQLPDGWEVRYRLNPLVPDAGLDQDGDGLTNLAEYRHLCPQTPCGVPVWWGGTDPTKADTDLDYLLDGDEINRGTKPREPDTDLDGLTDGDEVVATGTNPKKRDTDGDGLTDYQEAVTYRSSGVSPFNANTDGSGNNTNDDTLTDYQEIIRYRTEPNDWDTDGDGSADGRDKYPLRFDQQPERRELPAVNPLQPKQDAYVLFREDGYVDVMMQDAHGNESDIQSVEVHVKFNGLLNGESSWSHVFQYAERFDDGTIWGARVALPERMSISTSQEYMLTVTTNDGNIRQYQGASAPGDPDIKQVLWKADSDPVEPNGWSRLRVHESKPRPGPVQGGSGTESQFILPDPRRMAVEQIFAAYGNFSIHRVKPFAILETDLPNVTDSVNFAAITTFGGGENATWNGTLYAHAFEIVDPTLEPGLYATMADGGNNYFRTPKWLRAGVKTAWDAGRSATGLIAAEAVAQGASFLFGSDDPRAKGRLAGDIISGILVYGDVRDVVVGTLNDQPHKVVLGGVGIGLTWVGPGADGPYSAFKSGAKLIASVPVAGPRLVIKMADDIGNRVAKLKDVGDGAAALRFIADEADLAMWAARNTDKVVDFERVKKALPPEMVHALKDNLGPVTALSADLARVAGDAEAQAILTRFSQPAAPGSILPAGGADAVRELAEVAQVVRDAAAGRDPDTAGRLMRNIDTVRNVENGGSWWSSRLQPNLMTNNNGRWGYVFEPEIAAMLAKKVPSELASVDGVLNDVRLWDDDGNPIGDVLPPVQIDLFSLVNGKRVATEVKSGSGTSITITDEIRTQMEKQAAAVARHRGDPNANLANELHWYFEKPPSQGIRDLAYEMSRKYDLDIKLKDPNGGDYLI